MRRAGGGRAAGAQRCMSGARLRWGSEHETRLESRVCKWVRAWLRFTCVFPRPPPPCLSLFPAARSYPYNLDFDYGPLEGLQKFCINNLGDPFIESNYGVHSREFEVRPCAGGGGQPGCG